MVNLDGKRFAYMIVDGSQDVDGGYIPCIAVENESGYYPMSGSGPGSAPWNWGKDMKVAEGICDKHNESLGLTKEDACRIIGSSMFTGK